MRARRGESYLVVSLECIKITKATNGKWRHPCFYQMQPSEPGARLERLETYLKHRGIITTKAPKLRPIVCCGFPLLSLQLELKAYTLVRKFYRGFYSYFFFPSWLQILCGGSFWGFFPCRNALRDQYLSGTTRHYSSSLDTSQADDFVLPLHSSEDFDTFRKIPKVQLNWRLFVRRA